MTSLAQPVPGPQMASMAKTFALIDSMENAASTTYRLVLDRYPKNAKLLKSYGKFLENVKNDPWGAAKYYAEAEKQVGRAPGAGGLATPRRGAAGCGNLRLGPRTMRARRG